MIISDIKHPPLSIPETKSGQLLGRSVTLSFAGGVILIVAMATLYELFRVAFEKIRNHFCDLSALEESVKRKYPESFLKREFHKIDHSLFMRRLSFSLEAEGNFIKYLEDKMEINNEQMEEILLGSPVELEDEGHLFYQWQKKNCQIKGMHLYKLVFTLKECKGCQYTWVRVEHHPVSFKNVMEMQWEYLKEKLYQETKPPFRIKCKVTV